MVRHPRRESLMSPDCAFDSPWPCVQPADSLACSGDIRVARTVGAYAVRKGCLSALTQELLELLPVAVIVTHFLAPGADGNQPPQSRHLVERSTEVHKNLVSLVLEPLPLFFNLFARGVVGADQQIADDGILCVAQRRDGHHRREPAPIF